MKLITTKQGLVRLGAYVLLAGLLLAFVAPIGGWKALEVLTPSMTPAVHPGDLVLVHRVPVLGLKPGDIVTYTSPFHSGETITHRVVMISKVNGVETLVAKGDANKVTDPPVPTGRIVGRVTSVIPIAGRLLGLLRYPLAVLLLVIIPGLYVIWSEVGNIRRALKEPRPRPGTPSSRRIDGLYRLATLAVIATLATIAGGFTFAQTNSTASLVGNFLTVSSSAITPSPTPFPTPSPTAIPSPTGSPGPGGSGCGNVTISNTGPGSVNEVHCTNTNVTTNSSHTSVHITSHSSQSATSGSVTINGNTSAGTGNSGSVSNNSSDNLDVTIP